MPADLWSLIDTAGPADLDRGPRSGVASAKPLQRALEPALAGMDRERRDAALALALLWHDDLDGAHRLCQTHEGHPECDYVHALLHRREGDFANAKYWFREIGTHPIHPQLATAAVAAGLSRLGSGGQWHPAAMVDACAVALGPEPGTRAALIQVQAAEFRALAGHLAR